MYLSVPDEMLYGYMIYSLSKIYGISKSDASKHTEYDFWETTAYESLDSKKEEYLVKQNGEG